MTQEQFDILIVAAGRRMARRMVECGLAEWYGTDLECEKVVVKWTPAGRAAVEAMRRLFGGPEFDPASMPVMDIVAGLLVMLVAVDGIDGSAVVEG